MSDKNYELDSKSLEEVTEKDLANILNTENVANPEAEIMKPGFKSLLGGYIEYAKEVLENRALPDLRDGLKPVQRFALWYLHKSKEKGFQKSSIVSSGVLAYHPHNDDSAYEALTKMTDVNGTFNVPMLVGDGSMGTVASSSPPSAKRYTGVKLHPYSNEMFTAMQGVNMVPNFDSTKEHADVLPASIPYVLYKSADGIAVGFATNIPSFTPKDVNFLVKERIKKGKNTTRIVPDFASGGYIVPTERELDRLMRTGKGRFVVRAKVEIDGKKIHIKEVPHGTTIEKLKTEIEKQEIAGIAPNGVSDLSDKNGDTLVITCRAKNRVDEVLNELYTKTPVQTTFNSNLLTVQDKKLVITGVWGIIDRWLEWRRGVLTKQFNYELESAQEDIKYVSAFIALLNTEGAKEEVINLATKHSDDEAMDKVMEYVDCTREVAKWIIERRLNQFRNGDKYAKQYANLKQVISDLEHKIQNVDDVILGDMERVDKTIGSDIPRKTQISDKVYTRQSDLSSDSVERNYECYYEIKNGFIKKSHYKPEESDDSVRISGMSNSVLIAISADGEIYRVYGDDLPISKPNDFGTFIPTYATPELDNSDANILWGTIADGRKYVLTYSDGFVGFLDTSEFLEGAIKSRYLRSGISKESHLLTDIREYKPNSALYAVTRDGKHVMSYLDSIKQKSRTARTRVWFSDSIYDTIVLPLDELSYRIPNYKSLLVRKPVEIKGNPDLVTPIQDLKSKVAK